MSDGPGDASRPGRAATVGVTAAVGAVTLLVLLVALWASVDGPDDPLRGDGITPDRVRVEAPSETPSDPGAAPTGERPGRGDDETSSVLPTVVGLLVLGVAVALGLGALWLLAGALWRLRRVRLPRDEDDPSPPDLDPARAVATALAADARAHEAELAEGSPRNAVVLCWHRFEVQAEQAGVPRRPSETSAEFTVRLLALAEADPADVERLAALYREARFSEHELGEEARSAALEVLRAIHRDLRILAAGARR